MITLREGEKKNVGHKVERIRGTGAWTVTTPQYRILNSSRTVVAGFDWAAANWDDTEDELYALFDSTVAALSSVGIYSAQFRGVIGSERYQGPDIVVQVLEVGP